MSEPRILRRVILGHGHAATGRTRHFRGAEELPSPRELRIVQYDGDPGYYLLYCDENGNEMTDTYHDTLDEAMSQATWEFNVSPEEWQKLSNH
jgi:hypothetical protein